MKPINKPMYTICLGNFLLLLGCLSLSCCGNRKEEPVLLQIGDYSVTRGKFVRALDKLNNEPTAMTREEKISAMLDNFINAGLLLRLARESQCSNDDHYRRQIEYYKGILYSKYGKMIRCGLQSLPTDMNDDHALSTTKNTTLIDYIYIPTAEKKICKDMQDRMNAGAMTVDLMQSPRIEEWKRLHLRFYTNIPTSQALLPEGVLQKVKKMPIGKLSTFHAGPGTYIVKVTKQFTENGPPPSAGEDLLQQKMAQAVEKGDTLMDAYDLGRLTRINYDLYGQLDFSVLPIANATAAGSSDPVVVEFLGKRITETQLKTEISGLPLSMQALFRSRSTRIMAVTNYVLHANAGLLAATEKEKMAGISRVRQLVNDQLRQGKVTDTVSWLVHFFRQRPVNGDTGSRLIRLEKEPAAMEKSRDYSWIFDDNQPGRESLRLNFQAIKRMSFGRVAGVTDNEILASYGSWKFRVGDFRKQLDRLTPFSRVDLCKNNNGVHAIYYLAKSHGVSGVGNAMKINYALMDRIDLVGEDHDSLTHYEADGVVAALYHTELREDRIRDIIANMPENERSAFLPESDYREDALKKILVDQFWQGQVRPEQLAENPAFREELKNYEDWLLVNTYYHRFINVEPYELNEESLDPYIKRACKLLSRERLRETLLTAAEGDCIKVDDPILSALGGNIKKSAYASLINKNCH